MWNYRDVTFWVVPDSAQGVNVLIGKTFTGNDRLAYSQVEELKTELSLTKLKLHQQNRSLESANSAIDEHQHNLKLALKNSKFLEDSLQAKKDSMSRTHLQQETAVVERESLRELLQKTELQNYNLVCELNELKAQHNCDVAYQKEFINQDAKIREQIAELNQAISNLAVDQKEIMNLSNKIEVLEELEKTVSFYRDELYKSKESYKILENKYVTCKATVDEFQKLCNENNDLFQVPQESLIIQRCEETITLLKEQLTKQQDIIVNLTNSFKIEKENNAKLYLRITELENKMEDLTKERTALKEKVNTIEFKDEETQTTVIVKSETIEILDV
ncbi:hypothetical protein RN001_007960 [Aquatica leii]|uniref:Uncharacterized protein n=1 Tax=Aquatica leii TaxID=1421715 RepID=A0AAN7PX14_9COLE|nr:hypothetical protein RN001_007960 [Aquatica leii]